MAMSYKFFRTQNICSIPLNFLTDKKVNDPPFFQPRCMGQILKFISGKNITMTLLDSSRRNWVMFARLDELQWPTLEGWCRISSFGHLKFGYTLELGIGQNFIADHWFCKTDPSSINKRLVENISTLNLALFQVLSGIHCPRSIRRVFR